MEEDKNKWINEVFNSLEGSSRATPDPGLFDKIEAGLATPEARVVPLRQWKWAAMAASILLFLNIWTVRQYLGQDNFDGNGVSMELEADQQLISNYSIYDI